MIESLRRQVPKDIASAGMRPRFRRRESCSKVAESAALDHLAHDTHPGDTRTYADLQHTLRFRRSHSTRALRARHGHGFSTSACFRPAARPRQFKVRLHKGVAKMTPSIEGLSVSADITRN